ncbi:hypothetical protein GCM10009801_20770 [Streptomyces albiaxialis]|uniref:Uncharacterized protein n=1 Tax=Streptomyces albiaxialis TaxID=329523 RepID=A0ABN2VRI0_9ACTN
MYVAVLLLPALWVMLFALARLEERLFDTEQTTEPTGTAQPSSPRHARRERHLRLVPGGRERATGRAAARRSHDAA